MANHYTLTTLLDKGGEKSAFKLFNGAITAASIAGFLTDYGALKTAVDAITVGTLHRDMWVGDSTLISSADPGTNLAQRENKLLVVYEGNTSHKLFTTTIPTIDLTKLTFVAGAKDNVSLTTPVEVTNLITAIEALGRTPDSDTETITVRRLQYVGRNI